MMRLVPLAGGAALEVWHFAGSGGAPAAYLQGGLHADETAPMLVLHHLLPMLAQARDAGALRGDVTVLPRCNPIGLRQFAHHRLHGRFEAASGRNFNRGFPGADADSALGAWQRTLLGLSAAAGIVLDLHTDDEALPYVYVHAALWPAAADLPAALGAAVCITWDGDGGGAFEEAVVARWQAEGGTAGRLAATVELRGQACVDDTLARGDAAALLGVLRRRGVVGGDADAATGSPEIVPIGHVQTLRAPSAGVLVYARGLGDVVAAGAALARIVTEPGNPQADIAIAAPRPGRLFARCRDRYVDQHTVVAKLTGDAPFAGWAAGPLDE